MATADNFFISNIDPKRAKEFDDWDKLFGMGSKPTSDPDDYPPVAEVHGRHARTPWRAPRIAARPIRTPS